MLEMEKMRKLRSVWIAALLGVLLFIAIYGIRVLNPEYTSWLYSAGSDLTQHYLGWMAYRNSDWSFPIGLTDQLSYPEKISIVFTDSIPLFAVAFKFLGSVLYRLFSLSLPENFQYFGLWGILTFMLNGAFSARILQKYLKNDLQVVMGSVFFILSFQVLHRMFFHTALASHWIIFLSMYPMVYRNETSRRKKAFLWALTGFFCSSIHLYFLAMCGLVFLGFAILDFDAEKKLPVIKRVAVESMYFLLFLLTAVLTTYILGGFTGNFTSYAGGLGRGSFNLNGFVNPQAWSVLLPQLPVRVGQYEGFAYLGAGVMFLLLVALVDIVKGHELKRIFRSRMFAGGAVVFVAAVVTALSPRVTWGERVLFEIPVHGLLEKLWATFRSTGRIVWVCVYLLFLFALCADYRSISSKKKTVLIMAGLCIQLIDLSRMAGECHMWSQEIGYEYQLDETVWNDVMKENEIEHILFTFDYTQNEDYPLTIYALEHDLTTNDFYFARDYAMSARGWRGRYLEHPQESVIYLWKANNTLDCPDYDLNYFQLDDNYVAGIKGAVESERKEVEIGYYTFLFNGKYISQGYDENNMRYLNPGGVSSGPYIFLPQGTYEICVEGEGIGELDYHIADNNSGIIENSSIQADGSRQVFKLVCEDVWDYELKIENNTNKTAVIKSIEIVRVD